MKVLRQKFRQSVFVRMLVYSFIPLFVMFILIVAVQTYQASSQKEKTISRYTESLRINLMRIENSINQIVEGTELLSVDEAVMEIMMSKSDKYEEKVSVNYDIQETLKYYKNMYSIVENVVLINKNNGYVIEPQVRTSIENYYSSRRIYEDYNLNFWENFEPKSVGYEILPPVKVSQGTSEKYVFPMIISMIRNINTDNFIVIDLKCDEILDMLSHGVFSENSVFFIKGEGGEPILFSGNFDKDLLTDNEFLGKLNNEQHFEYSFNRKKYLVISQKENIGFMNRFRYVVMTPVKGILYEFNAGMRKIYLFLLLVIVLMGVICFYLSRKLYNPLAELIGKLKYRQFSGKESRDEFELISDILNETIKVNQTLNDKIESNLPLIGEQKLLKMLNSNGYINNDEVDAIFCKSNFLVPERCFIVVYIKIKFTSEFYDCFNQEQYIKISDQLYCIFETYFNEENKSFLLSQSNENFIILFNARKNILSDIVFTLEKLAKVFETDKNFMKLSVGVGNEYTDYEGMRKSYKESVHALAIAEMSVNKNVVVYRETTEDSVGYLYSIEQEAILLNYMVKGDSEGIHNQINMIINEICNETVDKGGLKRFYGQLLQTALRASQIKGADLHGLLGDKYISLENALNLLTGEELSEYVNYVVKMVTECVNDKVTHKDISGLIQYIDTHYNEEIYLENMAEKLNTSSKYLSRIVKEQLGINFAQYVASVRIKKAKELLVGTNKTINEIMVLTGFTMRNTFIRTFRKFEGVTPSEYRKIMSNDIAKEMTDSE